MKAKLASSMSYDRNFSSGIDLRGFSYAMEALRRRRTWDVEQQRTKLARLQRLMGDLQQKLSDIRSKLRFTSADVTNAGSQRLDPRIRARSLTYLSMMQADIAQQQQMLVELEIKKSMQKNEYVRAQLRLEALNNHRERAIEEYAVEWMHRQTAETDRDWLARRVEAHAPTGVFGRERQELQK